MIRAPRLVAIRLCPRRLPCAHALCAPRAEGPVASRANRATIVADTATMRRDVEAVPTVVSLRGVTKEKTAVSKATRSHSNAMRMATCMIQRLASSSGPSRNAPSPS